MSDPSLDLGTEPPFGRLFNVRPGEMRAVCWSAAYFFFLMAGYYVIHPIREAMGLTGGVEDLKWLFMVTLAVMFVANPVFSALVSRFRRRRFITAVYWFFAANLLAFYALFTWVHRSHDIYLARAFFVWVSVFNLFVVSLFWAMMADLFDSRQSKRLFGLIAVGGTSGAIVGSAVTASLAAEIGEVHLMVLSAILLLAAWGCAVRVTYLHLPHGRSAPEQRIGGHVWAGITHVVRSPYLICICLFLVLHTLTATFAYFAQGTIVESALGDRQQRATLFASMDLLVNILTVVIQIFLTSRIIRTLGVGWTLALLPLVVMIGFAGLAWIPTIAVLVTVQVVRRATNYALSRPARESLFTVLPREDKYKAKNFIDTFVYRGGDAIGAVGFAVLSSQWIGWTAPNILLLILPLTAVWLAISLVLGRQQRQLERVNASKMASAMADSRE